MRGVLYEVLFCMKAQECTAKRTELDAWRTSAEHKTSTSQSGLFLLPHLP